ncbi:hypothetical protein ALC60_08811 [Trachymyrmex zeteki]|uniref:Uncharacterized protein n=1 Tax=Mycetomoellerius zeteki TaxID=64791 RepID=A0A151WWK3_9HYME|nr:hypothetical protein ALC60_08811 [Trachymyrmex zeteki]
MTESKGCAATGERERMKERKRGLDDDDDSGVNTARSSGQSATKAPEEKSHLSLLRLFSRPLVPLFRREHIAFSIGTNARVLRLTTVEPHADAHMGRSKHRSLIVPFASALIWYCVLCRAPTANSIDREREHRQLAAIVSIGANMTSFDQQFHCPTEKSVVDFIDPFHALMHLQYGKVKFIVVSLNVDIHHKSTHTVSDRDEENTHPAQGVAARSQKRRAFIFCPFELIIFRSNGDITIEWEAIANRFTPRCLVFASLVETRLRQSRTVE